MKTSDSSEKLWMPDGLMSSIWLRAHERVSHLPKEKSEAVAARVYQRWIEHRPFVKSKIEAILCEDLSETTPITFKLMQSFMLGENRSDIEPHLREIVAGTSLTTTGLTTVAHAYYSQNFEKNRKNVVLVDTPDENAGKTLNELESGLNVLSKDFKKSLRSVLQDNDKSPILRAAAIAELGEQLNSVCSKVYEKVYMSREGKSIGKGRRRKAVTPLAESMIDNFVSTRLMGMSPSDHALHPKDVESFEDHKVAAESISKDNVKVARFIKEYHAHLCYFFETPTGPVLTDPIVIVPKHGRPNESGVQ